MCIGVQECIFKDFKNIFHFFLKMSHQEILESSYLGWLSVASSQG